MSVVDSVVSGLKANSSVTSVVSTRIYQEYAYAKAAMPYIVVYGIDDDRYPHFSAASGLVTTRVQVDCVASSITSRDSTSEAVRGALDGMTNKTLGTSPNTTPVKRVSLDSAVYETLPPPSSPTRGGLAAVFTRKMDFMVTYNESVPTFA